MTRPQRAAALAVALCLAAAACTGGDGPAGEPTAADEASAAPGAGPSGAGSAIAIAPGAQVDVAQPILDAVGEWIATDSGLSDMLREEIVLDRVTRTRDVQHLRFVQQHGEVSVRGAQFIVHVRDTGEVLGASQSLVETLPGEATTEELTQAEAADIAGKAVPGTVDGEPAVAATWLETGEELRLGWEVLVTTDGPPDSFSVVVDATTGAVLTVDRLSNEGGRAASSPTTGQAPLTRGASVQVAQGDVACDAPPPPSACIFVVDPISATGNPALTPDQANATLVGVPLPNLLDPTSGDLIGRYVQIAPQVAAQYRDPDGVHGQLGRGGQDITFESAMTYYWIDYTQQIVQELGFDYHADDPVDVVPIEPQFPDNAFYIPTEDRIHMGIGTDGVNEAEDAQGIIHEYGHALLQAAVPNITSEEGGAIHEGFADLVSVLTTLEFRNGDVACLFAWAERGRCLRRIDTDLVYPDDLRFAVHEDGQIFSGAIWEVFTRVLVRDTGLAPEQCQDVAANPCDAVRDEVYATLLGGLPFLTPNLTIDDAAAAFAASDQTFFEGRNAAEIAEVLTARGLSATGTPAVQIGDLMDFEQSDSVLAIKISHTYRGDLAVTLDVIDAAGQPLCGADLVTPDPADDGDNLQGRFQLEGTDCAPFLPPGPDQVWLLTVVDTLEQDEGTLFQFSISHQGQRFVASGLPAVIPDFDQVGVTAAIGGTAPVVVTPGQPPGRPDSAGGTAAGAVTLDYAISHTYAGDLIVQLVVGDPATGEIACRVDVRQPDARDDSDDPSGSVDVSDCAGAYPPGPGQAWVLRVADVAQLDEGQVTAFRITGPDGITRSAPTPVAIPDADPRGVVLAITG